jgi:hypothetical protein
VRNRQRAASASKCGALAGHGKVRAATTNGTGADNGASGGEQYDFDLFTIGAGSGGVRAARFAASTYGMARFSTKGDVGATMEVVQPSHTYCWSGHVIHSCS